jgi:hypothetical protein
MPIPTRSSPASLLVLGHEGVADLGEQGAVVDALTATARSTTLPRVMRVGPDDAVVAER